MKVNNTSRLSGGDSLVKKSLGAAGAFHYPQRLEVGADHVPVTSQKNKMDASIVAVSMAALYQHTTAHNVIVCLILKAI